MIIKGRSPTMRHVSRTHGVALDWLFDRINLDSKIQIKYVESKNQLADILTKGSFTSNDWNNMLHLFNIMNHTTFSRSHSFLSTGKQSEMSKRIQNNTSLESPAVKAKACCFVSRDSVSVRQSYSRNPKGQGSTRDSQVTTSGERYTTSGWPSAPHAMGNRVQNGWFR